MAIPARIRYLRPLEHLHDNLDGKAIKERTVVVGELTRRPAGDRYFAHSEIQVYCIIMPMLTQVKTHGNRPPALPAVQMDQLSAQSIGRSD